MLDFVIVLGGCLEFVLEEAKLPGVNMRALRTLRILRPLKAMKTIPSLRMQVSALIRSVYGLFNVIAFLCAIFLLFGVVGLQWFHGSMHYACRVGQSPLLGEKAWEKLASHSGVCTPADHQLFSPMIVTYIKCPRNFDSNSVCGSPLDFGLNPADDSTSSNADIAFGINSFDDIGAALIAVFQIVTNDSWSGVLVNL